MFLVLIKMNSKVKENPLLIQKQHTQNNKTNCYLKGEIKWKWKNSHCCIQLGNLENNAELCLESNKITKHFQLLLGIQINIQIFLNFKVIFEVMKRARHKIHKKFKIKNIKICHFKVKKILKKYCKLYFKCILQ